MAVGLGPLPTLHPVPGFELGIASAGIKRPGRKDVVVMRCAEGSRVAGVTTTNAFCAAPVLITRERMHGPVRYLLTNTGNANAGTGPQGLADARRTCAALAALTGVDETAVLPFSTGVIGEPLPVQKIESALQAALDDLSPDHWAEAATGIMTTDTLPKGASRQFQHDGVTVTVTGISKGAGMIRPNMATMLGYIATDAKVAGNVLQDLVRDAANKSFNRITIDGDQVTFHRGDQSVQGRYASDGFEILTYAKGNRGVRFIFQKTEGDEAAPQFIQFSDHRIAPSRSDHYHLYWGDDRAALLEEVTNWPTFYPASLDKDGVLAEMLAH